MSVQIYSKPVFRFHCHSGFDPVYRLVSISETMSQVQGDNDRFPQNALFFDLLQDNSYTVRDLCLSLTEALTHPINAPAESAARSQRSGVLPGTKY